MLVQLFNADNRFSLGGFSGHNTFWMIFLYIVGATISTEKYLFDRIKLKYLVLSLVFLIIFIFLSQYPLGVINERYRWTLVRNTSPLLILEALLILLICIKKEYGVKSKELLSFASPAALGIYLIHEHYIVRQLFIINRFQKYTQANALIFLGVIIASAMGIFIVSILIEKLRLFIVRLLGIDDMIRNAEKLIIGQVW